MNIVELVAVWICYAFRLLNILLLANNLHMHLFYYLSNIPVFPSLSTLMSSYAYYFSGDGGDNLTQSVKKQNMKHPSLFVEGICF